MDRDIKTPDWCNKKRTNGWYIVLLEESHSTGFTLARYNNKIWYTFEDGEIEGDQDFWALGYSPVCGPLSLAKMVGLNASGFLNEDKNAHQSTF